MSNSWTILKLYNRSSSDLIKFNERMQLHLIKKIAYINSNIT